MASITPVALAVVFDQDRVLVGRRPPDKPLGGLWEFPGGRIEPGESPAEAAVRECLEETGVAVEPIELLGRWTHRYLHGTVRLHAWSCRPKAGSAPPHPPFRWLPAGRLAQLAMPAANAAVLSRLAARGLLPQQS